MDPISLQAHELRLRDLEAKVMSVQLDMATMKHELKANTEMTAKIEKNTEDLVGIFKAGNSFKKFMVWTSTIIGAVGVVYLFLKEAASHLAGK